MGKKDENNNDESDDNKNEKTKKKKEPPFPCIREPPSYIEFFISAGLWGLGFALAPSLFYFVLALGSSLYANAHVLHLYFIFSLLIVSAKVFICWYLYGLDPPPGNDPQPPGRHIHSSVRKGGR